MLPASTSGHQPVEHRGFPLDEATSCSSSVAAPNTHTSRALTRCICGILRVRSQSQASSSNMPTMSTAVAG